MDIEKEFLSYLQTYGNTKETDLIDYGIRVLGQPKEDAQKIMNKIYSEGYIKRVIHNKLGSNVVYIARGDWPLDIALEIEADSLGIKNKEKTMEEACRILEEAAIVAERRLKRKMKKLEKTAISKNGAYF